MSPVKKRKVVKKNASSAKKQTSAKKPACLAGKMGPGVSSQSFLEFGLDCYLHRRSLHCSHELSLWDTT